MMEINVVRKGSHTWLWVLIALLVIAVLYFLGASDTGTHSLIHGSGQAAGTATALAHTWQADEKLRVSREKAEGLIPSPLSASLFQRPARRRSHA